MWWSSILLIAVLALQACGFTPVYATKDSGATPMAAQIDVMPISSAPGGRAGQELYTHLSDLLGSKATPNPAFRLAVTLKQDVISSVIQEDRSISRYNLIYTANYTLTDVTTGVDVLTDKVKIYGSYDSLVSLYATYAAQQNSETLSMDELAKTISLRLIAFLGSHPEQFSTPATSIKPLNSGQSVK